MEQRVLLVVANAAGQKPVRMSRRSIYYSFCCAAHVFCACLMSPKEKKIEVTVHLVGAVTINYGFFIST